jgi:hypothetical protein
MIRLAPLTGWIITSMQTMRHNCGRLTRINENAVRPGRCRWARIASRNRGAHDALRQHSTLITGNALVDLAAELVFNRWRVECAKRRDY